MRAYLRLDPQLADSKAGYPDGAFRAFVECLTFGEQQAPRGRFRNVRVLRALLDKRSRWVQYLIDQGDLIVQPDGSLYIEGWDEWQEGDWKVKERVERIRARKRPDVTPPTVTPTVTDTVTPLLGGKRLAESGERLAESGERVSGEARLADVLPNDSDPVTDACRLLPNGGQWLGDADYRVAWDDLVRRFSREWVTAAIPLGYQDCIKRGKVRAWDLKRFTEWHLAKRNRDAELADEKARAEAQQAEAERHRLAVEEATPEQRERAELQRKAIHLGLTLGMQVPTDPEEVRKFVMKHGSAA